MKRPFVLLLIITIIVCTSCSNLNEDSIEISSSELLSDSSIIDPDDMYGIEMSINILKDKEPLGYILDINENTKQTLTVSINSIIDGSFNSKPMLTRLYLIEDGTPIEFSVNMSEYKIENDINYEVNKEYLFDIEFSANKDYHTISLLAFDSPDYIPIDSNNFMYNCIAYTFFNPNNKEDLQTKRQLYSNDMTAVSKELYGIDIGKTAIDSDSETIVDDHYMNDIILENDDELYAKYGSGDSDCLYYITLLVDGKIVEPLLSNGFFLINCENGSKCFEYPINRLINLSDGIHTMQLITIQAGMSENDPEIQRYDSTPVLRVIKR